MTQESFDLPDFKDRIAQQIKIVVNGTLYPLRRYTIAQEIRLKQEFCGDLETWRNKLEQADGETLVRTLHIFMEPTKEFKAWTDLACALDGTYDEKVGMIEAISLCITNAMPEVATEVKKRVTEAKAQIRKAIANQLTGRSSSTVSTNPTAGDAPTS